ncbi:microcystin-dependent protein [Flavobacterium sp. 270]|uniref:phage tail protein n=1 Tax=Flavobacterium sp. 270 TaxID=2512114 RepID=UPI0010655FF9|nr:tail fiber protein [Flavobacterium sp. 270]TDW51783.1 microcystin-dependent protein [Flavobacterium sp. 270]
MEGTIGEIRIFAGNFPPRSWMFCNGSSLSIANYEALYVLIGTTYGGDGVQTFNLPDTRSRVPIGTGQGPGLSNIVLGQMGGTEQVTMSVGQMPAHVHPATANPLAIPAYSGTVTSGSASNGVLAGLAGAYSSETPDGFLATQSASVTVAPTGGNVPFDIIQPSMAINYIICVEGIFPSRN